MEEDDLAVTHQNFIQKKPVMNLSRNTRYDY